MRRLLPLLALLLISPAAAETLDCAVIKSTEKAFELAMDGTSTVPGKEATAMKIRRQVARKADQTIVHDVFSSSDLFLRRIYDANGFLMETFNSKDKERRVVSYSTDITKDYFGLGLPFEFKAVMKDEDGKIASDLTSAVSFIGAVTIDLGGCSYVLTKMNLLNHGTIKDKAFGNRTELWYSRELKTSLYSRSENDDGFTIELRARDISTSFTPVE